MKRCVISLIAIFTFCSSRGMQNISRESVFCNKDRHTKDAIDSVRRVLLAKACHCVTRHTLQRCLYVERRLYTYSDCSLVVIMGCSCSGKSFLEHKLSVRLKDDLCHFPEGPIFWSMIDSCIQKGMKKPIVSTFPQNIWDLIMDRDGSSHFMDKFRSKCQNRFGIRQGNAIVDKYARMPIEFLSDMTAKVIVASSSKKHVIVTTHEHTYDDLLLLRAALEYNFFRMPIYPIFMYVSPETIAERLMVRNTRVLNKALPYYDLRLTMRPFWEFFKNLRLATPGEEPIDSLNREKIYEIIDCIFSQNFPVVSSKLKIQYPQLTHFNFENFFHKIRRQAFETISAFFMNKDIVDVVFTGDKGVCCFSCEEEIENFVKHLCG